MYRSFSTDGTDASQISFKKNTYFSTLIARMNGPGVETGPSDSILINPASSLSKCSDNFL